MPDREYINEVYGVGTLSVKDDNLTTLRAFELALSGSTIKPARKPKSSSLTPQKPRGFGMTDLSSCGLRQEVNKAFSTLRLGFSPASCGRNKKARPQGPGT